MSPNRVFNRLHKRKEILKVIREGRRVRGSSYDLIVRQGEEEQLRIAVVVPLLGMHAVARNRLKRRTKEALKGGEFLGAIVGDVVVIAKKEAYDLCYDEVVEDLRRTFSMLTD